MASEVKATVLQVASDPRYDVVYQEAVRLIGQQHNTIDNLRSRATFLASTATIGVSFLAAVGIFSKDAPPVSLWIVVSLFVLLTLIIGCTSAILWPLGWCFGLSPNLMIDLHIELRDGRQSTLDELKRDNALWLERHFDKNERKLNVLFGVFRFGVFLLLLETALLLFTVVSR